jgi:hypothetical protein
MKVAAGPDLNCRLDNGDDFVIVMIVIAAAR